MVPRAVEAVQAINKLELETPPPAEPASGGGDWGSPWALDDLFWRPPSPIADPRSWPLADAFTLYLMSILCRFSYQRQSPHRDSARDAILAVLGLDWTYTEVTTSLVPELRYDVWRKPGKAQIIAIQGTTALAEWLRNAFPILVPLPGIVTDHKVYAGILANALTFSPLLSADATGAGTTAPPTILAGHSLGGAVAQLQAGYLNAAWKTANPGGESWWPVIAEYTFGGPAWLESFGTMIPNGWLDAHCRCYLPGDPVPYATQHALARSAGVALGIELLNFATQVSHGMTRHWANKSIELANVDATARARYRERIWRGLLEPGFALVEDLVTNHQMSTYTWACWHRAASSRQSPADKMTQLVIADRLMDRADGLEGVLGGAG